MATPHISADSGDFASAVLMPGDPRRAARIAKQLFDNPRLVTDVRGMLGFTGTHQGRELSVMGSGMGHPSMAIYATELFKFYGVQRIIRVGTCGGIAPQVKVGHTVIALGAHTDSNFNQGRIPGIYYAPVASYPLVQAAVNASASPDTLHVGAVVSKDHFYLAPQGQADTLAAYGVLGVDMESAALYGTAAEFGREALTVLTVSDHLFDHSVDMSSDERENIFQGSLQLAVAAAFA